MRKQFTMTTLMTVLICLCFPIAGWAQQVIIDGFNYYLKDGKVTLCDCDKEKQGNLVIPASIIYEGTEYPVTGIDLWPFSRCLGLTSITIPESVITIGNDVFTGCRSLTTIEVVPDNMNFSSLDGMLYSKDKCELLACPKGKKSVVVFAGVTHIGDGAFKGCTGLTSLVIPEGVTTIGKDAFEGCNALTSIVLPESMTNIEKCLGNCGLTSIVIPKGVTHIGEATFSKCRLLTTIEVSPDNANYSSWDGVLYSKDRSELLACPRRKMSVIIPESVLNIVENTFLDNDSLTTIEVSPDNANYSSWDGVLYSKDRSKLLVCPRRKESVTIPEDVTCIGKQAFHGCTDLTSIVLPEGVVEIGSHAFHGCTGLTSIVLPKSVKNIGEWTFFGCNSLTSVVLPEGVMEIGNHAFCGCDDLTSIVLPESVTNIGEWAFASCNGLTSIVLPESVTNIGEWAFYSCIGLTSIVFPKSVLNIGEGAFNCCSFKMLYCRLAKPSHVEWDSSFRGISSDVVVYVPVGSKAAYESADGWCNWTIVEYDFTKHYAFGR